MATAKPTCNELVAQVMRLQAELDTLRRLVFGQKRERFVPTAERTALVHGRSRQDGASENRAHHLYSHETGEAKASRPHEAAGEFAAQTDRHQAGGGRKRPEKDRRYHRRA